MDKTIKDFRFKIRPTYVALAMVLAANTIFAQEDEGSSNADTDERVTVLGSRLKTMALSPTPVTEISSEDLKAQGTVNIADYMNELPQFRASLTPTTTSQTLDLAGSNYLDLRGLGSNRTLTLLNGKRHVPTGGYGGLDFNTIPSAAISRVEIITGGASAAWGSDAVAGVINVLYKTDLEGLEVDIQAGQSSESDNKTESASFAYGTKINDNDGHVLVSGSYNNNKGIGPWNVARDWAMDRYALVNGTAEAGASLVPFAHGLSFPDILGIAPNPFGLMTFDNGSPAAYGLGDTIDPINDIPLSAPYERQNLLVLVENKIAEGVYTSFDFSYSSTNSINSTTPSLAFSKATVTADNAYINGTANPADVFSGAAEVFIPVPLPLFLYNSDWERLQNENNNTTYSYSWGLEAELDHNWVVDGYIQYGKNTSTNQQHNNINVARLQLAVDAVDDGNGNIVCRSGGACIPLNVFGLGTATDEAINYVTGSSIKTGEYTQKVAAMKLTGDLFETDQGAVAVALGLEYRDESYKLIADDVSAQSGWTFGNALNTGGGYDVSEGFAEIGVPVLSGLTLNGAARYTDYSSIGAVTTWKTGAVFDGSEAFSGLTILEDLTLRATVSNDIRAPSINELYLAGSEQVAVVDDPVTGADDIVIALFNGGNPNLTEESAKTQVFGIIYAPSQVEGLQIAVDWYDIDIDDAVGVISPQEIIDGCLGGDTQMCLSVERLNGANADITGVHVGPLNLDIYHVSGVDITAQYLTEVGAGSLRLALSGNLLNTSEISTSQGTTDGAGVVGSSMNAAGPETSFNLNVSYTLDALKVNSQIRYLGAADNGYLLDYTGTDPSSIDNNVSAEVYLDLSASYRVDLDSNSIELYMGINNVLDNDPPIIVTSGTSFQTNNAFYDVIGRYIYAGARMNF